MFFYILGIFVFSILFVAMLGFFYVSMKNEIKRLNDMIENEKKAKKEGEKKEMKEKERDVDTVDDTEKIVRNSMITKQPHSSIVQHSMYEPLLGSTSDNILYKNVDPIYLPRPLNTIPLSNEFIRKRDAAVVSDPLYPPLNRSSVEPHDNYRLLGYLVGEESTADSWQLYGRKVNNTRSQFYARPTDKNIDMKIQIEDNMMPPSDRIRDLDNLPDSIILDHPLFTSGTYKVTENPRTEFNSHYF